MKNICKIMMRAFWGGLFISTLLVSTFATDVSLTLSSDSGYEGDSITISGTYDPDKWITVKAMDSDGNIVFIQPVFSADNGLFSADFVVPRIDAGTLTIVAGTSSDVVATDFMVKAYHHSGHNRNKNHREEKKQLKDIVIINSQGEKMNGNVEKRENGYDIIIDGKNFESPANGSVKMATPFVELAFNERAAKHISDAAGLGKIVLSIEKADTLFLSHQAQEMIGDRPVYEFTLTADGSEVSSFGGGLVYVTIPYTLADGEDINRIVVYYISDDGELSVMKDSVYDGRSIMAKFSTEHFSTYAVGYNEVTFDDVAEDVWYYDAVSFCAAREITNGTGSKMFSPHDGMTRAMLVTILYRLSENDGCYKNSFSDVKSGVWYEKAVAWAVENDITNGVGDGNFAPEDEISMEQMVVMLYRFAQYMGIDVIEDVNIMSYHDVLDISDYAYEAMQWVCGVGMIEGDGNGYLNPGNIASRAQIAKIIATFIQERSEY